MESVFSKSNPPRVSLKAHAKINLGLIIKGKRPDGYHLLETLMYPVFDLYDEVVLDYSEEEGCEIKMAGLKIEGDDKDNLCVKAYKALEKELGQLPGIHVEVQKRIPAGAGLGGGSSNAAAVLKGLNTLLDLGLSPKDLAKIGTPLGADVPFFIYDEPMMASGIGTELVPFEIKPTFKLRLETPPIHSSTVAAYKALDYSACDAGRDLAAILKQPIDHWKENLVNDLEKPVINMYPEIGEIKTRMYEDGAFYAAMSGSGSSVFGLFSA